MTKSSLDDNSTAFEDIPRLLIKHNDAAYTAMN